MSNAEKDWYDSLPDQIDWLEKRVRERDKRIADLEELIRHAYLQLRQAIGKNTDYRVPQTPTTGVNAFFGTLPEEDD